MRLGAKIFIRIKKFLLVGQFSSTSLLWVWRVCFPKLGALRWKKKSLENGNLSMRIPVEGFEYMNDGRRLLFVKRIIDLVIMFGYYERFANCFR